MMVGAVDEDENLAVRILEIGADQISAQGVLCSVGKSASPLLEVFQPLLLKGGNQTDSRDSDSGISCLPE
jgi:hypothetical protein